MRVPCVGCVGCDRSIFVMERTRKAKRGGWVSCCPCCSLLMVHPDNNENQANSIRTDKREAKKGQRRNREEEHTKRQRKMDALPKAKLKGSKKKRRSSQIGQDEEEGKGGQQGVFMSCVVLFDRFAQTHTRKKRREQGSIWRFG